MKSIHFITTSATLLFMLQGCEARPIDVSEQSSSEVRANRGQAPPTGLKRNPGRPIPERPIPPPGPGH